MDEVYTDDTDYFTLSFTSKFSIKMKFKYYSFKIDFSVYQKSLKACK